MRANAPVMLPIGAMAIVVFVVGLVVSFWVADIFQLPPALFWATVVVAVSLGVFFLEHPKLYLFIVFLYLAFLYNGFLFGAFPLGIPLARFIDELWLAVPIAIIVMRAVNRQTPAGATIFPALYLVIAIISYRMNHVPAVNSLRVILSYLKFYIFWYFTRAIGPWTDRQRKWAFGLFIALAFIQFPMDVYWHRSLKVSNPDWSLGTIGGAHYVGYVSVMGLFLLAGWFLSLRRPVPVRAALWMGAVGLGIAYNFIFMTGTKHALFIMPLASIPFLLTSAVSRRVKTVFVAVIALFALSSWAYLNMEGVGTHMTASDYSRTLGMAGKSNTMKVILGSLVSNPLVFFLGAGPGNFCSSVALFSLRPLAVRHILPFTLYNVTVNIGAASSVLGTPMSALFTLLGEFGLLVTIAYFWFWISCVRKSMRMARDPETSPFAQGQLLGIASYIIFLLFAGSLMEVLNLAIVSLPPWILLGMYWPTGEPSEGPVLPARFSIMSR